MRKKRVRYLISAFLMIILCFLMTGNVYAYNTRSSKFNKNYSLSGNLANNMVTVASKQIGKTTAQLTYSEAWCADFVLDCARLAKVPTSVIPYTTASCANCTTLFNTMKSRCNAVEVKAANILPGDLVFYYCTSEKTYVHVGIYAGNGYYIEGNVNSKVLKYKTDFMDTHGHSTKTGVVKRVYLRPFYPDVARATVGISKSTHTYTGSAIRPSISVKLGNKTLKANTDYTYAYSNNTNAGTASIIIKGKGSYYGTRTVSFKINPYSIGNMRLSTGTYSYTGKALAPSVKVTGPTSALVSAFKKGTAYTVSYSNNIKPGRAVMTLTGKGNFTGTRSLYFYIAPPKIASPKLTVSNQTITVRFSKSTGATGYQICFRKKGASTWSTANISSTACNIKNLARLTTYQVRVRPFVKVGTTMIYGPYTSIVSATTKLL